MNNDLKRIKNSKKHVIVAVEFENSRKNTYVDATGATYAKTFDALTSALLKIAATADREEKIRLLIASSLTFADKVKEESEIAFQSIIDTLEKIK